MIKANELRIGNLVEYGGEYCKVVSLFDDGIFSFDDENNDTYSSETTTPNPIPITPQILWKANFIVDCVSTHDYKRFDLTTIQTSYLIGDFDEKYFEISSTQNDRDGEIVYNHNKRANLKYLHQLQNLYFALTGEELKIEL